MAFTTVAKVKQIVFTSLQNADINEIIAESDAIIRIKYGTPVGADKLLLTQRLSSLMTAKEIWTRIPDTRAAGEVSHSFRNWFAEAEMKIDELETLLATKGGAQVIASAYQFIDEDERYVNDPE